MELIPLSSGLYRYSRELRGGGVITAVGVLRSDGAFVAWGDWCYVPPILRLPAPHTLRRAA